MHCTTAPLGRFARLSFLGSRTADGLSIVAARIYLDTVSFDAIKPHFVAGPLEAGQWDIPQDSQTVEEVARALVQPGGLSLNGIGQLRLASDRQHEFFIGPPASSHALSSMLL